uniref:Type III pantothenate kinase n=1 Tax=Lygus hesperus TaxID=30085 RepID=A0A0A9YUG2_LYGHE
MEKTAQCSTHSAYTDDMCAVSCGTSAQVDGGKRFSHNRRNSFDCISEQSSHRTPSPTHLRGLSAPQDGMVNGAPTPMHLRKFDSSRNTAVNSTTSSIFYSCERSNADNAPIARDHDSTALPSQQQAMGAIRVGDTTSTRLEL